MHTMKHARRAALALGACLTLAACAGGDVDTDTTAVGTAAGDVAVGGAGTGAMEMDWDNPRTDAEIVTIVARANAAEVSSSQLAEEKATNARVKEFARMMTQDHTALNEQVNKLNIQPAASETSQDMKDDMMDKLEDLRGKSGAEFDRAFMDYQVEAHERTLQRLQTSHERAQSAELKATLNAAIPKIQQHLQQAQQIRQALGG